MFSAWNTRTAITFHSISPFFSLKALAHRLPARHRLSAVPSAKQVGCATIMDSTLSQDAPAVSLLDLQQSNPQRQPGGMAKRKLALHVAYCGTGYAGETCLCNVPQLLSPIKTAEEALSGHPNACLQACSCSRG